MAEMPATKVGEMVRKQALLDCEINIMAPEGAEDDFDKWDVIKEAELQDVEYAHGDLHTWFEDEVTLQERVAAATHHQPAEYKNHRVKARMSITWDLDPEEEPFVEIEVEHPW